MDERAQSKSEAIERGLKVYFTGKPCKNGHLSERRTSNGQCIQCLRDWLVNNPERVKANHRRNYEENKQAYLDKSARQRKEHPDRCREQKRKWRRSPKGQEQSRNWVANNKEKHARSTSSWKSRNRHKVREYTRTRQATKLQATPAWADREAIQAVYDEAYRLELETGKPHHVDHIIPLQGKNVCGLHVAENLQPLEGSENCSKSNR